MNTYEIARRGTRYRVIETLPGRGTFEVAGFRTEMDAKKWLEEFLRSASSPLFAPPEISAPVGQ
jgi:hypothetical protein